MHIHTILWYGTVINAFICTKLLFFILPKRERSMAPRLVCFGVRSRKLSNVGQSLDGWPTIYYLKLLRASEGTLSRRSRLHLQSLAPTNPLWACVVGYNPFSLCVIHKNGLCPSSGDINRLMMLRETRRFSQYFVDSPCGCRVHRVIEEPRQCLGLVSQV
jgi:hypothetical protein